MTDISAPALEKAKAKVQQLVPNAPRVETKVRVFSCFVSALRGPTGMYRH